jgi:hypothetical protein
MIIHSFLYYDSPGCNPSTQNVTERSSENTSSINQNNEQEVLETTNSPNFFTLFNNNVTAALFNYIPKFRGSSVSIASGYGLDDRLIEFDPWQRQKDFSCSLCVQTGSWAHPASCTMGTRVLSPG